MEHKNAKAFLAKVSKLATSELFSLAKPWSSIWQQDLCIPEDIRNKFGSFDFTNDDPLELWKYLEPVIEEFHGDVEKYCMTFYGLLHKNLLPQIF